MLTAQHTVPDGTVVVFMTWCVVQRME